MKHVRLIVLALAAILLFASCDQVLEVFYPEFKKGFEGQKDAGITVKVEIDNGLYYNESLLGTKPIRVKLVPYFEMGPNEFYIDAGSIRDQKIFKSDILSVNGKFTKDIFFGGLYNAMWAAFVFVDKNDDNKVDYDEISRLATIDGDQYKNKADFRYEIRPTSMLARLEQYSKIDGWILDQLNSSGGGGGGGSPMIPVAGIGPTPGTVQINTNVPIFADGSYDPDGYIAEYIWVVKKNGAIVPPGEQRRGQSDFNFTFSSVGNYEIILKVKDNGGNVSPEFRRWITVASSVVEKRVHITGSNTSGISGVPVRFGLVNRFSFDMPIVIDTFSDTFEDSIQNPPPGDWFLIAWIDEDWDKIPDSTERGVVGVNIDQSLSESLASGPTVDYLNLDSIDTVNIVANIGPSSSLPEEFTRVQLANNTPITLQANVNLGVAYEGKGVLIVVWGPNSTVIADFEGAISGGVFNHSFPGLSYHPTPGLDSVWVYIDMDGNGWYDDIGVDRLYGEDIFLLSPNTTYPLTVSDTDLILY